MADDEKATKWHHKSTTRPAASLPAALRLILAHLERGAYITVLRLRPGGDTVREYMAQRMAADLPEEPYRRKGRKAGRKRARARKGETRDDTVRRLARERKQKQRARRAQKEQST